MPAKSKDQQRAAGIALDAKRKGTVDELPEGSASKQMAQSMSKEELEELAGTKHKGLPKDVDKKNESVWNKANSILEQWEKALMVQEEMLDTDDDEGQIATQNPKPERVKKRNSKKKQYKDKWPYAAKSVASHSRHPLSTNTAGARVAEQKHLEAEWDENEWHKPHKEALDQNDLSIIFEQEEDDPVKYLPPDPTVDAAISGGGDEEDGDDGGDIDEQTVRLRPYRHTNQPDPGHKGKKNEF